MQNYTANMKKTTIIDVNTKYLYRYHFILNNGHFRLVDICHKKIIFGNDKSIFATDIKCIYNMNRYRDMALIYDDQTKSIIKIYKLFNKIVFLNLKTNENNIYELN